jgi:hypothetical protein
MNGTFCNQTTLSLDLQSTVDYRQDEIRAATEFPRQLAFRVHFWTPRRRSRGLGRADRGQTFCPANPGSLSQARAVLTRQSELGAVHGRQARPAPLGVNAALHFRNSGQM